jgi:anti-sigma B factor antagonist
VLLTASGGLHKRYKFARQGNAMSKMEILHSLIDNIPVLSVSGKIDAMTSKDLEVALVDLINQNKKILIIDMGNVVYLSSSGLRVLMASQNTLRKVDGDLMLAALQPFVRDVFSLTGAIRFFSIYPNAGDAIKSLKKQNG